MPGTAVVAEPRKSAWDGFLSGPENALAFASASALARGDESVPPLLVLHGPAGTGKTRILQGLVAERLERRPGAVLAHVTGEAFAAACAEANLRPEGWGDLRGRYREVDLLVIDDIHAVLRNALAVMELMHTLDALDARGASIAASARLGPGQWTGWPSRLVNRFLGGLSIKLDPPGIATRRRYVLDRARDGNIPLTADAVDALALAADGFRTLDGWLAALRLEAQVDHKPFDRHLVEPFLSGDALPTPPTVEAIARAVADKFAISLRDLRGHTRRAAVTEPRHLAMYLTREATGLSFALIGTYFSKRDPKTVRHACLRTADRLATDPALNAVAEALRRGWSASVPSTDLFKEV